MTDEQNKLMVVLGAIIQEAGGEIWIPAQTVLDIDPELRIKVEFHQDTEELKITLEAPNADE